MARRGLPAKYAKMGFKKGWAAYKRAHGTRKTTKSRKVRKIARRRRYTRRRRTRRKRTIPILPLVGALGPLVYEAKRAWDAGWGIEGVVDNISQAFTGYSTVTGVFDFQQMKRGLLPAVAGIAAHKILNMLGVNRAFANLPAPLNKLRL